MWTSVFQILKFGLDKSWASAKFDLVSSVYLSVARIYDYLIELNDNNGYFGLFASENFASLSQAIYVFAGIFMLFRVTIAMINMIINPDLVTSNDSGGGGKLLIRIFTSLLMLIMFTPKGWIFNPYNGILMRLERGILDSMGNFMYNLSGEETKKTSLSNEFFADNVEAATNSLTCFYYEQKPSKDAKVTKSPKGSGLTYSAVDITAVHKVIFYASKVSGAKAVPCKGMWGGNHTCYYKVETPEGFKKLSSPIVHAGSITRSASGTGFNSSIANCPVLVKTSAGFDGTATLGDSTVSLIGFQTEEGMKKGLINLIKNKNTIVNTEDDYVAQLMNLGISGEALNFARSIAKSFQQCQSDLSKTPTEQQKEIAECEALQDSMFTPSGVNEAIVDKIVDGTFRIDTITSIIVGVAVMIYLAFVCVEVIVRRFKLMLLEVLAPIPIIAYSDPKDETFSKWSKMYLSTFAELFLKLFAIKIGMVLFDFVHAQLSNTTGLLTKFLYIVAILLFIKFIPDMISGIFGIKVGAGSFKDIWNTGKKALGVGASVAGAGVGLAVGAAIGAKTAPQGSKLLQSLKGGLQGAGGGWKKDPFAGARNIASENSTLKKGVAQGSTFFGRMKSSALNTIGLPDDYAKQKFDLEQREQGLVPIDNTPLGRKGLQTLKEEKNALDAFSSHQKAWENAIDDQLKYRNFDGKGIAAVDDYYAANTELTSMQNSAATTKAVWKRDTAAKIQQLKNSGDTAGYNAAVSDYTSGLKMSDADFMANYGNDFINEKSKAVAKMSYEAKLAARDYEIEQFVNDPTYRGMAGTEGLFENIQKSASELEELGLEKATLGRYTDKKDAAGNVIERGMKSMGASVGDNSRQRANYIDPEERDIATKKRELENSTAKFDHDLTSRS